MLNFGGLKDVSLHLLEEAFAKYPVKEPNNKFAVAKVIRGDLIKQVSKFGYTVESIEESIMYNKATHQATTYYLLE